MSRLLLVSFLAGAAFFVATKVLAQDPAAKQCRAYLIVWLPAPGAEIVHWAVSPAPLTFQECSAAAQRYEVAADVFGFRRSRGRIVVPEPCAGIKADLAAEGVVVENTEIEAKFAVVCPSAAP